MSIERDALQAVLEGLDIPFAATTGHDAQRTEILKQRVSHVVICLEGLLRDEREDRAWRVAYLRERLAEHPATGYVTAEQAAERLKAGMSWSEAVRLDEKQPADETTGEQL